MAAHRRDQAGGGLGGVQRVQSQDHPLHRQAGQQGAGGGALALLVGDLALAQDHAVLVADRADQEDSPALGGACPAQRLAIQRRRGPQAGRGRMSELPRCRAALFPLGGAGGVGDLRHGRLMTDDIGDIAADRGVQCVGVQLGQDPAEGPFARDGEQPGERIAVGAQPLKRPLRDPGSPLPDRRHAVTADHQGGARGQRQDNHQRMPQPTGRALIGHRRQPAHQRRFHHDRVGGQFRFPQRQVGDLVKPRDGTRAGQRRWGHERDSCDDPAVWRPEGSPEVALFRMPPAETLNRAIPHQNSRTPGPCLGTDLKVGFTPENRTSLAALFASLSP